MTADLALTRPPYLGQVFLVVDHEPDVKVRYKIAEAEDVFARLVAGEAKSTNVPSDAPPEVPRLEIREGKKHLLIATSRIQLALSFEPNLSIDRAYEVVRKNALEFFNAAQKFQNLTPESQIGLVIHINQPAEQPKASLSQFLAGHLSKGGVEGMLATFEIKLGFEAENNLYRNFAFNVYEVRQIELPAGAKAGKVVQIDMRNAPIKEVGIGLVLDINNKIKSKKDEPEDSSYTFEVLAAQILAGMDDMFYRQRQVILPIVHPRGA